MFDYCFKGNTLLVYEHCEECEIRKEFQRKKQYYKDLLNIYSCDQETHKSDIKHIRRKLKRLQEAYYCQ